MKIEGHIFWGEPNSPYNFVSPDEDTGALSEIRKPRRCAPLAHSWRCAPVALRARVCKKKHMSSCDVV